MRDKHIKLIYFSLQGSESQEIVLSWKRIFSILSFTFVVMLLLVGSIIALFTDFYHSAKIASLSRTNASLIGQIDFLSQKIGFLENKMQTLEKENNDLRIFADMPPLNEDIRQVGVGGAEFDNALFSSDVLPVEVGNSVQMIHLKVEELERRLHLFEEERNEIRATLEAKREELMHLPSIRPVINGRISDKFGLRIDPFTDILKHHEGLDISAPVGTKVHAAAAGVVILAKNTYIPGKGYGKEIILDHGNGIKTRYAHLSKILVRNGQKVKRWDVIGYVGETGKTTGPHLHYEVLVRGKPVNPDYYILYPDQQNMAYR